MKLQDSVAIVTGASRGIGRAIALSLAREGANVVCAARSSADNPSKVPGTINETAEEVESLGRRALAVGCDITKDDEAERLVQRTLAAFGRIDILVNNAGGAFRPAPFLEVPTSRWDGVMALNLRAPMILSKTVAPQMIKQGGGRIINVSSGIVLQPWLTVQLGNMAYFVSKRGLEGFTEALALELLPYKIAVNCLRVEKRIPTEGWQYFHPDADISQMPKAEEAADATAWLARQEISYTGHIVTIDEAIWGSKRED